VDFRVFSGWSELVDFHCMLCCFDSGPYWITQLSICCHGFFQPFGTDADSLQKVRTNFVRCSVSSVSFLRTIFAHTFIIPKISVKINVTVTSLIFSSFAVVLKLRNMYHSSSELSRFSMLSTDIDVRRLQVGCHTQVRSFGITLTPFENTYLWHNLYMRML
jgi:hypothetical protein